MLMWMFIRYPASFILPIVYDYEPKGNDDHVVRVMQTYLDLVIVPLGPVATIVIETFPFRMFTHTQYCSLDSQ
jgi:hypothetical protein